MVVDTIDGSSRRAKLRVCENNFRGLDCPPQTDSITYDNNTPNDASPTASEYLIDPSPFARITLVSVLHVEGCESSSGDDGDGVANSRKSANCDGVRVVIWPLLPLPRRNP